MAPEVAALDLMMLWNSIVGFSLARAVIPNATANASNDNPNVLRIHPPVKEPHPQSLQQRSITRLAFPERSPQHLSDHRFRQLVAELYV